MKNRIGITIIRRDDVHSTEKYEKLIAKCDCGSIISIYLQQLYGKRKITEWAEITGISSDIIRQRVDRDGFTKYDEIFRRAKK